MSPRFLTCLQAKKLPVDTALGLGLPVGFLVTKGYRLGTLERAVPPSCRDRFPQRSWYQDLGTKKNGELERWSLSKIEQGGTRSCRPPARGSGGLEAPQEQRVWGAAAPQ